MLRGYTGSKGLIEHFDLLLVAGRIPVLFSTFLSLLLSVLLAPSPSLAQSSSKLTKMSAEEMRSVSGQSLLNFHVEDGSHSFNSGRTFARIEVDAAIEAITGVSNALIGDYSGGADINANDLIVRGQGGSGTFRAENPYIELAFDDYGSNSSRSLEGIRVGVDQATGELLFDVNQASGSVITQSIAGKTEVYGSRTNDGCVDLGLFGEHCAPLDWGVGIQMDQSEDLWMSINRDVGPSSDNAILWEYKNPEMGYPGRNPDGPCGVPGNNQTFHTDGSGFWLHTTHNTDVDIDIGATFGC